MTSRVVGVVCALAAEARLLGPATRRRELLSSLADGTLLAVSGMGAAAATHGARTLVDAGVGALVSWGMAGGLEPALAAGTIFLPREVIPLDGPGVVTASKWHERLSEALTARLAISSRLVTEGRLLTSPTAIGSLSEKAALFAKTGASAVDMESLAVAETARARQIPFIAVRVIVDSAADALPRAVVAAADKEGHLQIWSLLGALAREPSDLRPLIRLGGRYRAASRSLAAVARLGSLAPYVFGPTSDSVA